MSSPTMSENYKNYSILATLVQASFLDGEPSARSIQSAGVSINGAILSFDKWDRAKLPEEEYFAATQGDKITLQGLVNLAKRYIDAQG